MSKKKRLTLNTDYGTDLTKGKDYKIQREHPGCYVIIDDIGDVRFVDKSNFDESKPKKKKPKKQKGLTNREYFAAEAMNGLLSKGMGGYDNLATWAVQYADQLIEELNKKKVNE